MERPRKPPGEVSNNQKASRATEPDDEEIGEYEQACHDVLDPVDRRRNLVRKPMNGEPGHGIM